MADIADDYSTASRTTIGTIGNPLVPQPERAGADPLGPDRNAIGTTVNPLVPQPDTAGADPLGPCRDAPGVTADPLVPDLDSAGRLQVYQDAAAPRADPGDRYAPASASTARAATRRAAATRYLLAGVPLAIGCIVLWAFLDKAFRLRTDAVEPLIGPAVQPPAARTVPRN